jgi:hypothetical protein
MRFWIFSISSSPSGVGSVPLPTKPVTDWGVADDVPGVFAHLHLDDDVALENALFDDAALAVLDLDHLFLGNEDLEDLVFHVEGIGALADDSATFSS